MTAGYDYGAKRGIAPAGLPTASIAARLAALPPVGSSGWGGGEPCTELCRQFAHFRIGMGPAHCSEFRRLQAAQRARRQDHMVACNRLRRLEGRNQRRTMRAIAACDQ